MPKIKTHKSTAKRFKLSGTGKIMHLRGGAKGGRTHLRRRRPKRTLRAFDRAVTVETKGDQEKIQKLAPYLNKKKRS